MRHKKAFFFDTVKEDVIRRTWDKMSDTVMSTDIRGITTDPKMLDDFGIKRMRELDELIPKLCELVTEIRDGWQAGTIHIQLPSTLMLTHQILKWIEHINQYSDGYTFIALKVPPFLRSMYGIVDMRDTIVLQSTGITDCATALRAFSFKGLSYVTMPYKDMIDAGIPADDYIKFVMGSYRVNYRQKVITSGMTTLDMLERTIQLGTIPTLNEELCPKVVESKETVKRFIDMWEPHYYTDEFRYCPPIDETPGKVTDEYFRVMDKIGHPMYEEFISRIKLRNILDTEE
jgi:hypothetical protein